MNDIAARLAARLFDQALIQNQFRSAFVEEMIRPSLGGGWKYTGDSWCGWDFERSDRARLEVKQSAAYQTWSKARKMQTKGAFDIAPRTGYFTENGAVWTAEIGRPADVYVFAWNPEEDHRPESNWKFFVLPTNILPEKKKTIPRTSVETLAIGIGQPHPMELSGLLARVTEVLTAYPPPVRIDTPSLQA